MSEPLLIHAHSHDYAVGFERHLPDCLKTAPLEGRHFIIDKRVAGLYAEVLGRVLGSPSVLLVEASEDEKSLERLPAIVSHLVARGLRRDHVLVAIGGGIIQDITCFLAATMLRGVAWEFLPTTLLAQSDSCIGSKSSINCAGAKNILGTFTPPRLIHIGAAFLKTLTRTEMQSGVGEILKAHAIDGPASFERVAADYRALFDDHDVLLGHMRNALTIKKRFIEEDEFDQGPRLVFNYGHSFGHAIESATDFAVPHGIAVSIGMDMANSVAVRLGFGSAAHARRMQPVLRANYTAFAAAPVPFERFLSALAKDKKNTGAGSATLILPDGDGRVFRDRYALEQPLISACADFFSEMASP